MKQFKIQLRLYIAEKLLSLSVSIVPKGKEGHHIRHAVWMYFRDIKVWNSLKD